MIHRGIVPCIYGGDFGSPWGKTRPDFAADKTAATVFIDIFHPTADGRAETADQIRLARAVLRPTRIDIRKPVFRENFMIDSRAEPLYRIQPNDLQIQIVVGWRIAADILLHIKIHVVNLTQTLKWRAERPADIFSVKTAQYLFL